MMQIVEDVTVPEFGRLLRKIFVLSFPYFNTDQTRHAFLRLSTSEDGNRTWGAAGPIPTKVKHGGC